MDITECHYNNLDGGHLSLYLEVSAQCKTSRASGAKTFGLVEFNFIISPFSPSIWNAISYPNGIIQGRCYHVTHVWNRFSVEIENTAIGGCVATTNSLQKTPSFVYWSGIVVWVEFNA